MPIVFSFFAEVLSREKRGEHLSWLCMFWMIGEIYASAMAWAIIPHYGEFNCYNSKCKVKAMLSDCLNIIRFSRTDGKLFNVTLCLAPDYRLQNYMAFLWPWEEVLSLP